MATTLIYSSIILSSVATLSILYYYFNLPAPTPPPFGELQFSDSSQHKIPLQQIFKLKNQFETEGKGLILTLDDKDSRDFYQYSTPYQPKCLKRPYVIFIPATNEQAQKAFKLILHHKQQFTIFSGGHDNECRSTTTQALFNTNLLKNISVHIPQNDKQDAYAVIGSGVRWMQAYTAIKDTEYDLVGGLCPTVGVSGFTLGGGFNWAISTFYGIGSQNVLEMKVLKTDGELVTANWENEYKDLMWGMLGSGGKNLGIALQFKFKLHHYPEKVYTMFSLAYKFSNDQYSTQKGNYQLSLIKEVYKAWVHEYKSLQDDQRIGGTAIQIGRDYYSGPRTYTLYIQGGCKDCDWNAIFADIMAKYPAYVLSMNVKLSQYQYETQVMAPMFSEYPGQVPSNSSAALTQDFSDNMIDQILSFFIDQDKGVAKGYQVQATHVKGAVKNPQHTSFAAPELRWKFSTAFVWMNKDQEESNNKMTLQWNKMMQRGAGKDYLGGYINYMDFNLNDYQNNYFNSTTVSRLQEIKAKYDPNDVFSNVRGIPEKVEVD